MSDYWTDRALPVLRALEAPSDRNLRDGFLSLGRGRAEKNLGIELSDDAAHDTILQLSDAGYVEFKKLGYETGGGAHFSGLHITGRGLQVLGEWPRFEVIVSPLTLAALLDALAEYAPADEAREMKRAASFVRGIAATTLKSLAIGAGSQLLKGVLGIP
jgi:hypothetical protein